MQPIQMQLSMKPKIFSLNFIVFLKSIYILEHFDEKDYPQSLSTCSIIDSKIRG